MSLPIIGILLDCSIKKKNQGGYANYPWYALRHHYSNAVSKCGGLPILIPYESKLINAYLKLFHGLLLPGGVDIHPSYYGEKIQIKNIDIVPDNWRTEFELRLIRKAVKSNVAILAICAGQQALNVALGGSLYQDISEQVKTKLNHSKNPHAITIAPKTKLRAITSSSKYKVNSFHHQAVKKLGKGLLINAQTEDGIIEGIEHESLPFCIGVEWHPEFLECPQDVKLFNAFIKAAKKYAS